MRKRPGEPAATPRHHSVSPGVFSAEALLMELNEPSGSGSGSHAEPSRLGAPVAHAPPDAARASPAVSPPRQPFRSRTSHYPPPPAAQSSSASPSAPHRSACRVSAAYPGAPARGSASRRAGSCGRPRRFALLFLCPASAGKRATAPVQPLSTKPNSVAVPSDTPSNGWPSFASRKGAERTQRRVHCQNAGQCTALMFATSRGRVI